MNCTTHKTIIDEATGETVCSTCGIVFEEKMVEYNMIDYTTSSQALNLGQTSRISKIGNETPRSQKNNMLNIIRLDNRLRYNSDNNKKVRMERIGTLCDKLGIPQYIEIDIFNLATKVKQDKLTSGRSLFELDVGILFYICKKLGIPKSMHEVEQITGVKKGKIFSTMKLLVEKYGTINDIVPLESLISKYANILGMTPIHTKQAIILLNKLQNIITFDGRSPLVIVAAILLTISRQSKNHKITQTKLANQIGVCDVSIRHLLQSTHMGIL